ncbi:MAG: BrnA antitoxin family protein [Candidatus Korobacteraceae bacterium]
MTTRKKPNHIRAKDWHEVDSPPLTARKLAGMRPLGEVYPDLAEFAMKRKRGQRGPQKAQTKKPVTIRIDHDVLDSYKATGPGWQTRMNDALRRGAKSL